MTAAAFAGSVLRHGGKSVRHGGLPFFFAVLMTGLGLFTLAAFVTLLQNVERMAGRVQQSVAAVAFLQTDSARTAEEIRAQISLLPDVGTATLVTPEDALARARRGLQGADALEGSAGLTMPWVVEVTPKVGVLPAGNRAALEAAIKASPGVDEVMHPGGEIRRVDALLNLLHGAGIFLFVLIAGVVLVVTSNAVKLTVLARKDEIAIMKLVGATDLFVRAPFLLAGLVQGALGAALACAALLIAHATLSSVVALAFSGALGTFAFLPLPVEGYLAVLGLGAGLGVFGALFSVGRFLR